MTRVFIIIIILNMTKAAESSCPGKTVFWSFVVAGGPLGALLGPLLFVWELPRDPPAPAPRGRRRDVDK